MHDGAPAHRTKLVKKLLSEENIPTLEWPGNSPDLNSIENAWNVMKNKVQEAQPVNISELTHVLKPCGLQWKPIILKSWLIQCLKDCKM